MLKHRHSRRCIQITNEQHKDDIQIGSTKTLITQKKTASHFLSVPGYPHNMILYYHFPRTMENMARVFSSVMTSISWIMSYFTAITTLYKFFPQILHSLVPAPNESQQLYVQRVNTHNSCKPCFGSLQTQNLSFRGKEQKMS